MYDLKDESYKNFFHGNIRAHYKGALGNIYFRISKSSPILAYYELKYVKLGVIKIGLYTS